MLNVFLPLIARPLDEHWPQIWVYLQMESGHLLEYFTKHTVRCIESDWLIMLLWCRHDSVDAPGPWQLQHGQPQWTRSVADLQQQTGIPTRPARLCTHRAIRNSTGWFDLLLCQHRHCMCARSRAMKERWEKVNILFCKIYECIDKWKLHVANMCASPL
jgi:hypothetical protein